MRITVLDPSRKVNHLSKVTWDRQIMTELTRSISSTRIGKPVLMMCLKVSKDRNISRGVDQENLICVRWNRIKNLAQTWRRWPIEEKEETIKDRVSQVIKLICYCFLITYYYSLFTEKDVIFDMLIFLEKLVNFSSSFFWVFAVFLEITSSITFFFTFTN